MKSMRKATAWAMALAIVSTTAMGATAYAEGETVTTAPAITTEASTEAPTEAPTAAPTETPSAPAVTVLSADFNGTVVTVDTEAKTAELNNATTGTKVLFANGVVKFDGTVIELIHFSSDTNLTDAQKAVLIALEQDLNATEVKTFEFSDSVTDVKDIALSSSDGLTIKFGKNIKSINPDLANGAANVTVQGYTGTVAETFAKNNNYTFVALDAPAVTTVAATPETTTATATVVTTTAKASTAKATTAKGTTTAKASDSPKTGDNGVGAIAGVLGLATVAGFIASRKKKD